MKAPDFKPKSVTESCVDVLREDILNGIYDAPRSFVIDRVAQRLGVSHTPIREAVRKLEAEGLLEYNRGRGVLIRGLNREEYQELRTLRRAIEPILIRAAARTRTPEQIAFAREALEAWGRLEGSRAELFRAQLAVKVRLYEGTGLVRTQEMHNTVQGLVARFHIFAWQSSDQVRERDMAFVADQLDAIEAGDGDRAVEIFLERLTWADGLVERKFTELA